MPSDIEIVNQKNIAALVQEVERQRAEIVALKLDLARQHIVVDSLRETVDRLGKLVATVQAITMGSGPTAR